MKKVALLGNPNVGKSLLFNKITGLNQKTGNYPGITVEKKTGSFYSNNQQYNIIDFPGIYSLYPNSLDEKVVYDALIDNQNEDHPDFVIFISEFYSLKRGLFLYQQIKDLRIPCVFVVNQIDVFSDKYQEKLKARLIKIFETKFNESPFFISAKHDLGITELKENFKNHSLIHNTDFQIPIQYSFLKEEIQEDTNLKTYINWLKLSQTIQEKQEYKEIIKKHKLIPKRLQVTETLKRYSLVENIIQEINYHEFDSKKRLSNKLDKLFLHHIWGYLIFFILLFVIFQSLFYFSSYPMTIIENLTNFITELASDNLSEGALSSLITNGIIPGIGGILIFIPQISLLFLFILIMEQSGYMSRVVFIMDRFMKPFGLNGKSMIPLLSGVACAVPAIMSARNIENPKERLLTILITPFMTCSARLPVYSILISLIIPNINFYGLNLRGITLMFMYLLGIIIALLSSLILQKTIKNSQKSYLIIDMPNYKIPLFSFIIKDVYNRCKEFILGAGKIIFTISIILWGLSSFSPDSSLKNWEAPKIENSFLGIAGKQIEPLIKPLGYDWKIGIAIISSVAAREVFVGTMKIIYHLEENQTKTEKLKFSGFYDFCIKFYNNVFNFQEEGDDNNSLINYMKKDKFQSTNNNVYTFATGFSLMIFYAFSMQCISTIGVVRQETNSLKWTLIQSFGMTIIAYLLAFLVYNLFI